MKGDTTMELNLDFIKDILRAIWNLIMAMIDDIAGA